MALRRMVLIDGTAALYRAFYAIPELTGRDGQPVNAVFGFVRMIQQLRQVWHPSHWVVALDGGLAEHRVEKCPEYKAQRPGMPQALKDQIPLVHEFLASASIPWLWRQKVEADDWLASLTVWAGAQVDEILIATSDKDMFQLVTGQCKVVPLAGKGLAMGPLEVREKTGVGPEQIAPWLAMVGDVADNIRGVPGIGAKTAARLLAEFGSVDGIYANLARAGSAKIQMALAAHRDVVVRNLELVRLKSDLPVPFDHQDAICVAVPDVGRLSRFYEAMGFRSMLEALRQQPLF